MYSKEQRQKIINKICELLAEGESLVSICKDPQMPAYSTIMLWLDENNDFSERYARARDVQADVLFQEILEIADNKQNDIRINEDGVQTVNKDNVLRDRLRVDARKWMAGKLSPKKYGDKIQQEHSGTLQPPQVIIQSVPPKEH